MHPPRPQPLGDQGEPAPAASQPCRSGRWDQAVALLCALGSLAGVVFWPLPEIQLAYDPNAIVGGAQALASGQGYRLLAWEGSPKIGLYPPGHSLLLSLGWSETASLAANLQVLRWLSWLGSAVALYIVHRWLRREGLPNTLASALCLALSLSPLWYHINNAYLSDYVFLGWLAAAAMVWQPMGPRRADIRWLLTGSALGGALFWRTAALPIAAVAAGICLWEGIRTRSWKGLLAFGLPLTASLALIVGLTHGGFSYMDNFRAWWPILGGWPGYQKIVLGNLGVVADGREFVHAGFSQLAMSLASCSRRWPGFSPLMAGIQSALFVLIAVCWIRSRRAGYSLPHRALDAALAGYFLLVIASPIARGLVAGERYFMAIALVGAAAAWRGRPKWPAWVDCWLPRMFLGFVVVTGLLLLRITAQAWETHLWPGPDHAEFLAWWQRQPAAERRLAVGVEAPSTQLAAAIGEKLLPDALAPRIRAFMPIFVDPARTRDQLPDYLLTEADDPRIGSIGFPGTPVLRTKGGGLVVLKIDRVAAARFRGAPGIAPQPPPAR